MSTLTITSPAQANGTSYTHNVGRAARALIEAILSFRVNSAEETSKPVVRSAQEVRARARENVSLYHLYTLAAPYDSVMPNLRQELEMMAGRDE